MTKLEVIFICLTYTDRHRQLEKAAAPRRQAKGLSGGHKPLPTLYFYHLSTVSVVVKVDELT